MLTETTFLNDLSKLVAFKTLSDDPIENKKALDFIVKRVSKKAIVKVIKNKDNYILIASNIKTLTPDVAYMVHVDVVAGKPEQFKMRVKKGIAIGRGVIDMKFSIPIGYELLNELITRKSDLTFTLVITTDEEHGGYKGGQFLADKIKFRPKALIVPDGGEGFRFINKSKGVCQLEILSKGKPSHASMPWDGKNAIEPLMKLGVELIKLYGPNNKKPCWKTTMGMGQISGGTSINQVCPEASLKLDFRYPETDSAAKIKDLVSKVAKKIDREMKVNFISVGLPTFTNEKLPVVKDFIKALEKGTKEKVKIEGCYGASDARHFAKAKTPILMTEPYGIDIHGEKESLDIASAMKFYQALRIFLKLA